MSETEKKKRAEFKCVHRHNGFSHQSCFNQANGITEKIAYFDIESSNLTSDFGIVLCYSLKHKDGIISNSITPYELKQGTFDRRLIDQLCEHIRQFDRIITWYGYKFDIPFVRSRAMLYKLDFPIFKEVYHTDAYQKAKVLIRTLHSKRLGVVSNFLGIEAKEHPLNPEVWLRCLSGNQDAIDFVQTHCNEDVCSLEKVWERIEPYQKLTRSSI